MKRSGLDENVPHRLRYLNIWSPVAGYLGRLSMCILAGGNVSLGVSFDVSKVIAITSYLSLCLVVVSQAVGSC